MTEIDSQSMMLSSSMLSSCEFSESIAATTSSFFSSSELSSQSAEAVDLEDLNNALMLFSVSGTRLTIRDGCSLEVQRSYNCVDKIDRVVLSPDKKNIMCAMYARETVEIFSLTDPEWRCRISEGVGAGLISADWTPDSSHIISQSDFGIQLRIWSLSDSSSVIISSPKHLLASDILTSGAAQQSYAFSDCGSYLAVLHRIELQDYIGIYSTNPWEELAKFRCQTSDACHIQWLPKGLHIIVADSPLQYKVVIYSPSGQVPYIIAYINSSWIFIFCPQLISSLEAYENALGIRRVLFPPKPGSSPSLMAIASFDGQIRFMSTRSWQVAFTVSCKHPKDMDSTLVNKENSLNTSDVRGCMLVEDCSWTANEVSAADLNISLNTTMNVTVKSYSSKAGMLGRVR